MLSYLSAKSTIVSEQKEQLVSKDLVHVQYNEYCLSNKVCRTDFIKNLPYLVPGLNFKSHTKGPARATGVKGGKMTSCGKDGQTYSLQAQGRPHTVVPHGIDNKTYQVVQTIDSGTFFTTSTTVNTYGSVNFTVNSIDQITQLAAVFDQYRIDLVECWLENLNQETTNSHYVSVIDYDDSNALTVYQTANDYQNAVDSGIQIGHYRRFVPHVAVAAYSGSFASFMNVTAPWIDCSSLTVQHYGLKVAAQPTQVASTITCCYRLTVSFRNLR
jgi:hypothetical protein